MPNTRIQEKSRTAKKVQAKIDYSTGGGTLQNYTGKKARTDWRGFPEDDGVPYPVVVGLTVVA